MKRASSQRSDGFQFAWLARPEGPLDALVYEADREQSIRDSIRVILLTGKGERPLDPSFGCNLYRFIYARVTESVMTELAKEVRTSLERCEPRIAVDDVLARKVQSRAYAVEVEIHYRIRQGGVAQSIVLPLDLLE